MKKSKKVRYAVVGLGHIAQVAMLPSFRHAAKNSELVALVSGDPVKLKSLGKKYRVKHLVDYLGFERLLAMGEVDAVYIATPNTLHLPFAELAARYGVHILCEKPLTDNFSDSETIAKAAEKGGVWAMTAYRLHFNAAHAECMKIARSGRLGDLKIFHSLFSYQVKDRHNIRLSGEMGGGPLSDIGIYCINAARYLFGAEPIRVSAVSASNPKDSRFSEVEEMLSVILTFPDQRLATFAVSFGAADSSEFDLLGTKARLRLESAYGYAEPMTLKVMKDGKTTQKRFPKVDQFAAELLYFSNCILKRRKPEPSAEEGVIDVKIIEAIRQAMRTGKSVEVGVMKKRRRPTAAQVITKPGLNHPPRGVHVVSES